MRRREFITLLGSAAAAWPLAARAQQSAKVVGLLDAGIPHLFEAFRQGMRELGYVEGRNITYVHRSADGQADRIPGLAAELVNLKVDIIVTAAALPVRAAMAATSTIPIVFAALGDALATRVVDNLARPGGNVTGLSFLNSEISAKRLELLREAFPTIQRIAVFDDPNNTRSFVEATRKAALSLGLDLQIMSIPGPDAFESAFEAAVQGHAQALDVLASAFFNANRARLVQLAEKYRLPAIYETAEYVHSGGLMAYGPNLYDLFRRAASYVDKILKGTKPGDLPVEQPTKFELVINLKSAKILGITITESFLLRADEIIE